MSDDDDERARNYADSCFIRERLQALDEATKRDAKATEDAYHRIILDLLRSHTPGPLTLRLMAGEQERAWWPKVYKKQRRRDRARARLLAIDHLTDFLADKFQRQGKANAGTLAERATAKNFGISVGGLRQRRYRYRKIAGLYDTFSKKVSITLAARAGAYTDSHSTADVSLHQCPPSSRRRPSARGCLTCRATFGFAICGSAASQTTGRSCSA